MFVRERVDYMKVEGVQNLYPTERNALISIKHQLMENMAWKNGTENDLKRRFEEQAKNRCGEIGLNVSVAWNYDVDDDPSSSQLYLVPDLIVESRVEGFEETDHDRMKDEIRAGEADGRVGVVDPGDPNKKLKDPKRKNIV